MEKNKVMIIIVICMTNLGFVAGLMVNNINSYHKAQEECYEWLETECPCVFPQQQAMEYPNLNLNLTGDE